MYQRLLAVAVVALILSGSTALAQCGCDAQPVYAPVASGYATYYAPSTAYYAPAPYVSYYTPPVSYASYYAPAAPYATYYAPAVVPYRAYYGVPGWSAFGAPRLYMPGQPVRNVLRAVTP